MAKAKTRFVCQSCGSVASRWQGQCAECGDWNSLVQESASVSSIFSAKHDLSGGGRAVELTSLDREVALPERMGSGIAEFDRAVGGGIVAGSAMLVGGDPGIGKSTLLLQALASMSASLPGLYVTGEESLAQVAGRAPVRLRMPHDHDPCIPRSAAGRE